MELKNKIKSTLRNPSTPALIAVSSSIIILSVISAVLYHSVLFPKAMPSSVSEFRGHEEILLKELEANPLNLTILNALITLHLASGSSEITADNFTENPAFQKLKAVAGIEEEYIKFRIQIHSGQAHEAVSQLRKKDDAYSNFLLGITSADEENFVEAYQFFKKADSLGIDSDHHKKEMLDTLFELKWREDLDPLLKKDEYRRLCAESCLLEYAILKGDIAEVIPLALQFEINHYRLDLVILTLIAGAGWFFILLHLGRASEWKASSFILSVTGVILGVISAYLTVIAIIVEEEIFGFNGDTSDILSEIIYAVLGIGLREELLKLICFLPLLPFLINKEKRFILSAASFVGLGFAIEENIGYYIEGGDTLYSRFLTANFFHMALTGYCGYYLTEAVRKRGEHIGIFITEFAKMTVLHGMYDFFIMTEYMNDFSFLSMTVFIWLSGEYLGILAGQRYQTPPRISLEFLFTVVLSVTVGAGFFLSAGITDPIEAAFSMATGILGSIIITIMFFRYFRTGGN